VFYAKYITVVTNAENSYDTKNG